MAKRAYAEWSQPARGPAGEAPAGGAGPSAASTRPPADDGHRTGNKNEAAASPWPPARDDAASRTLIERACMQLRDDIVEGRFAPGEKLRVEHLKTRYGVSAGTLREALTRVINDALVESVGQRGFRVVPMTLEDLNDVTNLRVHIEIEALRRAIRQGDAAWRSALDAAFEALSAQELPGIAPEARAHWEALNTQFHETLIAPAASPWTTRVLRQLSRHAERYRRWSIGLPETGRNVHEEHEQIYTFARSGQEARAALALEAHIRATPELLVRHWPTAQATRKLGD